MLAFALAFTAQADEAIDAKVTAAIVETIEMTTKGELDGWMAKYCDPKRCVDERTKSEWKAYQLKQANLHSAACLKDGKIDVSQRTGDAATDDEVRWYIRCEGRQIPIAMRFHYDKEKDQVFFSHLGF